MPPQSNSLTTTQDNLTPNVPMSGALNANISTPVFKPARPVAVVTSSLAKSDKENKQNQFNQLKIDLQNQRQYTQAMQSEKQRQSTVNSLIQRTPPIEPEKQIDDILKSLM